MSEHWDWCSVKTKFLLFFLLVAPIKLEASMKFTASTSDYVDLDATGLNGIFTSTSFYSWSAWVYLSNLDNIVTIFDAGSDVSTGPVALSLFYITSPSQFRMSVTDFDGTGSGTVTLGPTNLAISSNTWYFVEASKEPAKILELNVVTSSGSYVHNQITTTNGIGNQNVDRLTIGVEFIGSTNPFFFFNGYIDDVKIYNHVLTKQEILNYASSRCRLIPNDSISNSNTIGYWRLDDPTNQTAPLTGGIVYDLSPMRRKGTVHGNPAGAPSILNYPTMDE